MTALRDLCGMQDKEGKQPRETLNLTGNPLNRPKNHRSNTLSSRLWTIKTLPGCENPSKNVSHIV